MGKKVTKKIIFGRGYPTPGPFTENNIFAKLSSSSVPVPVQFELRLSLIPGYYYPPSLGKVEIQQFLDYLGH